MSKPDGGPAFPTHEPIERYDEERGRFRTQHLPVGGMSLRDYFAAHAPEPHPGWVHSQMTSTSRTWESVLSESAYAYADAMIAEGQK